MSFLLRLFQGHGKKVIKQATDAIIAADVKTASAAQLAAMEDSLNKMGAKISEFRTTARRERAEAIEAEKRLNTNVSAGRVLKADLDTATDPAEQEQIRASIMGLLSTIEEQQTEWEREEKEAVEAETMLAELEQVYADKAKELVDAKKHLEKAGRELERANVQKERAKERSEQAAAIAGLRDNEVGNLSAALSSMTQQAEKARAEAETLNQKAQLLKKAEPGAIEDKRVQEALARVGQGTHSHLSIEERFAAIERRSGTPALSDGTRK